MTRGVVGILGLVVALAAGGERAGAQGSTAAVEARRVQGNVYLLHGAGANIAVQVGDLGPVLVDTGMAERADDVLAAVRGLTPKPIRYIINTHADADHIGGNERLAQSGTALQPRGVATVGAGQGLRAEIIAHELLLNRVSAPAGERAPTPIAAWPTSTFSGREKDFFFNNEGIQVIHQPAAHTDGDSIVYFRRSDVVAVGDVYGTTSYPVIDAERGGSIQGMLSSLNFLLALVISGEKTEGGTMIVPGHGRISDEADLVEYRDMVTIVRDRIQDMIGKGMTLEQVTAARPTMEYDGLYGAAPGWTAAQFVEAVYRSLHPAGLSQRR
ncbi:MAG: MBL fold metallo-hydrolase [Acidobacteria bacterium]|nr:MBL fold metallo-hydrolase [Acidobacteriota bacterium]